MLDPLISVEEFSEIIVDENTIVLDASWVMPWVSQETGYEQFQKAHIPGAVFFDIDEVADTSSNLPHMLPSEDVFAEHVGSMGIHGNSPIIIYDRMNFMASARVWWMFRAMGHDKVRVLDGGLNAWQNAGHQTATGANEVTKKTSFEAELQGDLLVDLPTVDKAKQTSDTSILDARAAGRFQGAAPEPRPELSSGHIPNSINIPMNDVTTSDGFMKNNIELETVFDSVKHTTSIIASCGSGVSAAVLMLALARIGRWDVALYDGSWSEWANTPGTEITKS